MLSELRPTEMQVFFTLHLLKLVRRLPDRHVMCMTAGELRRLLQDLPYCPAIEVTCDAPRETVSRDATCYPPAPIEFVRKRKLPRGEPQRRIEAFLATCDQPQSAQAIAERTGVPYMTVQGNLHRGRFERDANNHELWRLRTVAGIPLNPTS